MEEASGSSSEDRLFRCPNCGNALPDLPDFSVYLCGTCGAVLRAKWKWRGEGGMSEISDDEKARVYNSKGDIPMSLNDEERGNRKLDLSNCSTSRSEDEDSLGDSTRSGKRNPVSVRTSLDQSIRNRLNNRDEYGSSKGSLEYDTCSSRGAGGYRRYYDGFNGFARSADMGSDRAELLRKIDELNEQLSQNCDVAENPKERMGSTSFDPYRQGVFGPNKQLLDQGHRVVGPPYVYDDGENVLYKGGHGPIVQDSYRNAYYEQVTTRAYQPYPSIPQMYHNEYPNPYLDVNSHPYKNPFHRPACSCSQCFNQNPKVPPVIPPRAFGNQRSHDFSDSIIYQHEISSRRGNTSEGFFPPNLQFRNQLWHSRGSSGHAEEKFDIGHQKPPRKAIIAHGSGELCRAISGGAPFVTCCHCFELLKLPRKIRMVGKNQNKMRCGACSSVMLYELSGKEITLSVLKQVAKLSAELADGSGDMPNESFESSHGCMNPCSNYDDHSYEFSDTKVEPFPANLKSNSDESGKRRDIHSSSSSSSEHEKNPGVMVGKDDSLSVELPSKDDVSLPRPNSPLHHKFVSSDDVGDGYVMVNKWSGENEGQQNSVEDASMETVMDISINESVNSGVSQEFFAGLGKRNTEELLMSSQNSEDRRSNVFVNGQLIPVREVKRAEDLAGPIQIGDYWYDARAGFWGVMGHPCLGIIPPNIPEFNYPIPKNCAAGNTGIFVNGRELHQKDLNLLANRGLPIIKNKLYLIEISGKVVDEQTGEELDSLGKLAPTVERAKHGFGMKVPKSIAEQSY